MCLDFWVFVKNFLMKKHVSLAVTRIQKDLEGLPTTDGVTIKFPDPKNFQNFIIRIHPSKGLWEKGRFDFEFDVSDDFPFAPPKVRCLTHLWHPNIEETGSVCLNLLRQDYKPTTSLTLIIVGLQYLFLSPNPDDPLNNKAAEEMKKDITKFKAKVDEYINIYSPKTDYFE